MAICSDIIDDLFKLEENDINITCCAVNWMRIPKIAPEEIINISTADKLAEMEAKFVFYDNALSEIRRENATIENRMNGIVKTIGPDKSAYPSKTPTPSANSVSAPTPSTSTPNTPTPSTSTPSTSTASTPTPSEYSASTPTPSASTSSEPSSSAHTPRAFLTRVSPSKPDVHADVTPAAPESYVTVVRRSYPKRLNLTSNKSARVSNASRESESRVSKESSNARRYVRRGGINNNNCLKSNIQCIEIRVQWTVHLGSSHMHVHAVTRVDYRELHFWWTSGNPPPSTRFLCVPSEL